MRQSPHIVERSFSKYKLEDQRRSFFFENLKVHANVYCNRFDYFLIHVCASKNIKNLISILNEI